MSGLADAFDGVTGDVTVPLGNAHPNLVETTLLKPIVKATVPARIKLFNVAEFYQTGVGFYYGTFADRFDLNARQTVGSTPERPYMALLLKANAYDTDILRELPETHLSTPEDIAGLIEAQPGGKSGFLLNNGRANIFYVESKYGEVFAVFVHWFSVYRRWHVADWKLDGGGEWGAGCQIFCPVNVAI